MLVRNYVGKLLSEYYAQPSNLVVGSTAGSLENVRFSSLLGEWHWKRVYRRLYQEQEGQWLTPVELFRPFYSHILANFVVEACREEEDSSEIHLVELGGGRGTNANLLLSHLQRTQPQFYDRVKYTIIDSSRPLHELQRQIVGTGEHANKVELILKDLNDVAENNVSFLTKSNRPTVAIALELLDNLPHDKVRRNITTRTLEQAEIQEHCDQKGNAVSNMQSPSTAFNKTASDSPLEEVFVPMTDPLLSEVLAKVPFYGGKTGRPSWVPTVACGVFQQLQKARPNSRLVVADFDWLPPPDALATPLAPRGSIRADGEPLVTSMDGTDYECYLESPPFCDILFPTNFKNLASFVEKTWDDSDNPNYVKMMKQAQFLEAYGKDEVSATKSWISGFSPLVHDFGNYSVLTVTRKLGEHETKP